jgi:hypothetical protein
MGQGEMGQGEMGQGEMGQGEMDHGEVGPGEVGLGGAGWAFAGRAGSPAPVHSLFIPGCEAAGMCLWPPLVCGFQGAEHYADDGTRIHLTVEAMPQGTRWEWLAWLARNPSLCRHGHAPSAASARRLAEDAALALDRRCSQKRAATTMGEPDAAHAIFMPADRRRSPRRHRPVHLSDHAADYAALGPGAMPGRRAPPRRR